MLQVFFRVGACRPGKEQHGRSDWRKWTGQQPSGSVLACKQPLCTFNLIDMHSVTPPRSEFCRFRCSPAQFFITYFTACKSIIHGLPDSLTVQSLFVRSENPRIGGGRMHHLPSPSQSRSCGSHSLSWSDYLRHRLLSWHPALISFTLDMYREF